MYKDFPLPNHTDAPKAHQAALCAGDQGKYWEMHDRIFEHQATMQVPVLRQHAAELKLDLEAFNQCLDSNKFALSISGDIKQGEELGVNSTPTMYVNGRPVIGAQPFEFFKTVIDEELERAGKK